MHTTSKKFNNSLLILRHGGTGFWGTSKRTKGRMSELWLMLIYQGKLLNLSCSKRSKNNSLLTQMLGIHLSLVILISQRQRMVRMQPTISSCLEILLQYLLLKPQRKISNRWLMKNLLATMASEASITLTAVTSSSGWILHTRLEVLTRSPLFRSKASTFTQTFILKASEMPIAMLLIDGHLPRELLCSISMNLKRLSIATCLAMSPRTPMSTALDSKMPFQIFANICTNTTTHKVMTLFPCLASNTWTFKIMPWKTSASIWTSMLSSSSLELENTRIGPNLIYPKLIPTFKMQGPNSIKSYNSGRSLPSSRRHWPAVVPSSQQSTLWGQSKPPPKPTTMAPWQVLLSLLDFWLPSHSFARMWLAIRQNKTLMLSSDFKMR